MSIHVVTWAEKERLQYMTKVETSIRTSQLEPGLPEWQWRRQTVPCPWCGHGEGTVHACYEDSMGLCRCAGCQWQLVTTRAVRLFLRGHYADSPDTHPHPSTHSEPSRPEQASKDTHILALKSPSPAKLRTECGPMWTTCTQSLQQHIRMSSLILIKVQPRRHRSAERCLMNTFIHNECRRLKD